MSKLHMAMLTTMRTQEYRVYSLLESRLREYLRRSRGDRTITMLHEVEIAMYLLDWGEVQVPLGQLADRFCLSVSTLRRVLHRLELAGLIQRERSVDPSGTQLPNRYKFVAVELLDLRDRQRQVFEVLAQLSFKRYFGIALQKDDSESSPLPPEPNEDESPLPPETPQTEREWKDVESQLQRLRFDDACEMTRAIRVAGFIPADVWPLLTEKQLLSSK